MRNKIFISHADADKDSKFAQWLSLQLAKEGYSTWCDETELLGGEHHWVDITEALEQSIKFLFVLSDESNDPSPTSGATKELHVAREAAREEDLQDFIIPLQLGELEGGINIQLKGINVIDFNRYGWAEGLSRLLDKLEKDDVPKDPRYNPEAVTSWWRDRHGASQGVEEESSTQLSNWFPIWALPNEIHFHSLSEHELNKINPHDLLYPAYPHQKNVISFAGFDDLFSEVQLHVQGYERTYSVSLNKFMQGRARSISGGHARHIMYSLLREAWEQVLDGRSIRQYTLSGDRRCDYFPSGFTTDNDNKVQFEGVAGQTYRKLSGKRKESRWHFGISMKVLLDPLPAFRLRYHVLYSDDGKNIWDSDKKLHKTRRSHCKNWWNPEWRDRLLAAMSWLSEGEEWLTLPLGSDASIEVRSWPVEFNSPVSYEKLL